jgi:hypothetical protein
LRAVGGLPSIRCRTGMSFHLGEFRTHHTGGGVGLRWIREEGNGVPPAPLQPRERCRAVARAGRRDAVS